jgi:iron complex outermembrane receptor protein
MQGDDQTNRFDPQTSIDYEIGVKGNVFNNKLQLSAALFYLDIKDIHVYTYKDYVMTASNADSAHSQGLELEALYQVTDNIDFNTSIGLVQTEYDNYLITDGYGNPINNKSNKIERSPSYTIKAGLGYHNPNGIYGRFDIHGQGTTYYDSTNTLKADKYVVADVKLGYLFSNWDIYAYIKNITDTD